MVQKHTIRRFVYVSFPGFILAAGILLLPLVVDAQRSKVGKVTSLQKKQLSNQLVAAVKARNVSRVSSLLEQGANPNTVDSLEWPVIVRASANGDVKILQALITHHSGSGK